MLLFPAVELCLNPRNGAGCSSFGRGRDNARASLNDGQVTTAACFVFRCVVAGCVARIKS